MSTPSQADPFAWLFDDSISESEWDSIFGPKIFQVADIKKPLLKEIPAAVDISFSSNEIQRTVDALVVLLSPANLSQRPPLRRTLRELLPCVCRWLTFLVQNFILGRTPRTLHEMTLQKHMAYLSQRLVEIAVDPSFEALHNHSKSVHFSHFFATMLHVAIHLLESGDPWFRTLFTALKRVITDDDMLAILSELPHEHDLPAICVHALIAAHETRHPDLLAPVDVDLRTFRQYHIVKWLARTLSSLAKRITAIELEELKVACANMILCAEMITCHILSGYTWVIEALDSHILPSIAKTRFLDTQLYRVGELADSPFRLAVPYMELINAIRPFTLIHPVALRVPRHAQRVLACLGAQRLLPDDPFNKAFSSLLREAQLSHEDIRRFRTGLGGTYCGNAKCPETIVSSTDSPKMKKCSQCHVVAYCSSKCQKQDWKANHREACPLLKPEHPGDGFRLSSIDKAYIKHMVQQNIFRLRARLLQEKATCEVGVAARSNAVTVRVMYNVWPFKIYIEKASKSLESLNCRHAREEFEVQLGQLDVSKEILVVVWHPGFTCHSAMVYRQSLFENGQSL
ncbi:hypothetical protein VNI00_009388 [Paramarasmius palmivorus]|uniref:phytol kinase n=1 Tax=Paramarasmius palmivorus TaxID=297713 RepID=A0AAW0CRV0_9AGAR